jgi:transcriptional regulator with XRE-family HTH domain
MALAEMAGCRRWMINRIEAGERSPSIHLLRRLVEVTGVSADEILKWSKVREAA